MSDIIRGRKIVHATRVQIPRQVEPLLRRIGEIGTEYGMHAYAVGGCVRDWLFGMATTQDLDVAVEGRGIELARAVSRALDGRVEVHESFGTATVWQDGRGGRRVDFATCRTEVYAKPAAYPRVTPATLKADLFRRDFTINAMAVALGPSRFGILVDPFQGSRDLRGKRLRILHPRSFLDDPSRILRGVRFAARFGLRWDRDTERAAREAVAAGSLGWLNPGRIRREFDRIGTEPDPLACLRILTSLLEHS